MNEDDVELQTVNHPERTAVEAGLLAGLIAAGASRWTRVGKPIVLFVVVAAVVAAALAVAFSLHQQ